MAIKLITFNIGWLIHDTITIELGRSLIVFIHKNKTNQRAETGVDAVVTYDKGGKGQRDKRNAVLPSYQFGNVVVQLYQFEVIGVILILVVII